MLPLLPSAEALIASRKPADDPVNWPTTRCPALQSVPLPVHPELHAQEADAYVHPDGVMGTYRQIFLDGWAKPRNDTATGGRQAAIPTNFTFQPFANANFKLRSTK